jgi:hypothetical protein
MNTTAPKQWQSPSAAPQRVTAWHNPLTIPHSIDVIEEINPPRTYARIDEHTGEKRTWQETQELCRITWGAGETKELPSRFDRAIHQVGDCGHAECERGGHWCRHPEDAGPNAVVQGGSGWQLVRAGQTYRIDPALVARPVAKSKAEPIAPGDLANRLAEQTQDPAITRARQARK